MVTMRQTEEMTATNGPLSASASSDRAETLSLPAQPLVRIRPRRGWAALNPRDLWSYRELLYFLAWRDVKVRYKQTLLGVLWAVLQPVCTMLIFWLFFGKLARMPSDNVPYPVFALAGLVPWTFFASAVTTSGNSLVGSANLVTKVYFPRALVPAAVVLAALVDLAIAFAVLAVVLAVYRIGLSWQFLLLPGLVGLLAVLALSVGTWLSAINVKYRDVRHAMPFVIQLWMFITPVIYPASLVPEKWRWLLSVNPLTGITEGFRAALFAQPMNWTSLGTSTALTVGLFIGAVCYFRRTEAAFVDII